MEESAAPLGSERDGVIWRKIGQRESGKAARSISALTTSLKSGWHLPALDRVKLFKLVWDLVGSEFAGRHLQYEKFYAGASFIIRNYNYREAPWSEFHAYADGLLGEYGVPEG